LPKQTGFGNASELVGFRLMALEPQLRKAIQAKWSYKVADMDRRLVAFKNESEGKITSWKWDFGDHRGESAAPVQSRPRLHHHPRSRGPSRQIAPRQRLGVSVK
jgi:hypothetical protein